MIKILVVDDDRDSVETLSQLLESEGMKVLGKGFNGKEAYELYK